MKDGFYPLMLPQEDIEKYGGKGAILNYIREKLPDMPIPPYVVKQQGRWLWRVNGLKKLKRPLIVRSSSPDEYADFEGIFESVRDVDSRDAEEYMSLEQAIWKVETSACTPRAVLYAKQNGFSLSGKVHQIIQEQSSSKYQGCMLAHPNNPHMLFIDLYWGKAHSKSHMTCVWDMKQRDFHPIIAYSNYLGLEEQDASFLADVYEQVSSLKEIAEGQSLFVEFGLHPFFLYQVRPFKKIETADFEVKKQKGGLSSDLAFGITPKEGIVLPVLRSFHSHDAYAFAKIIRKDMWNGKLDLKGYGRGTGEESLLDYLMLQATGTDHAFLEELREKLAAYNTTLDEYLGQYCLMMTSVYSEAYAIDLTVPHMKGLVAGGMDTFLTHDLMRLLKKAGVSVATQNLLDQPFFQEVPSGNRVRIISNGKRAVVMKE